MRIDFYHFNVLRLTGLLAMGMGLWSCGRQGGEGPSEKVETNSQGLLFDELSPNADLEHNKILFEVDDVIPSTQRAQFLSPTAIAHVATSFSANTVTRSLLFVADTMNNTIRRVEWDSRMVSTFAGDGVEGYVDNCPAADARFRRPMGLAASSKLKRLASDQLTNVADTFGALFVADTGNHVIRRIDFETGMVVTIAGVPGRPGSNDASDPLEARFNQPTGLAFVPGDNVLYIADSGNGKVRKLQLSFSGYPVSGGLSTISNAPGSWFKRPTGLAFDRESGYLYVADTGSHAVHKMDVSNGGLHMYVGLVHNYGHVDATTFTTTARVAAPTGLVLVRHGSHGKALYISDAASHTVRRYWLGTTPSGHKKVETPWGVAWKPGIGEGTGTGAQFHSPAGLALVANSHLVVVDQGNNSLRSIDITAAGGSTDASVSLIVGDANVPGSSNGWPVSREIGIPSSLACRNGLLYVKGTGIHEVNPNTGGVRTLTPIDVGGSLVATDDAVFGTTQYGAIAINLNTLAKENFGTAFATGQTDFSALGGSANYIFAATGNSNSPVVDNNLVRISSTTYLETALVQTNHPAISNLPSGGSGASWNGYAYFFWNGSLYRVHGDADAENLPLEPEQVAQPCGASCGLPAKFAINGAHVYYASGSTIKRRAIPSNPANPLGAEEGGFYSETEFSSLNGSICIDGTKLYVGDNEGEIYQVDIDSGHVNAVEPDFSLTP